MAKRRWNAQQPTIMRDLRKVIEAMDCTTLKLETDELTGEVAVIFDRNGRRYRKSCSKWLHSLDNLRAVQLHITYLYRAVEALEIDIESEMVQMLDDVLLSLETPPDDTLLMIGTGRKKWWEILGVAQDAGRPEVVNAYKALARIHHPDVGGNKAEFQLVRDAYEKGVAVL